MFDLLLYKMYEVRPDYDSSDNSIYKKIW